MILRDLNTAFKQKAWPLKPEKGEYSAAVKQVIALFNEAEKQAYLKDFYFAYCGVHARSSQQYAVFRLGHRTDSPLVPLTANDLGVLTTGISELRDPELYNLSPVGGRFMKRLEKQIERADLSLKANEKHVQAQAFSPAALGASNLG